jgi:dCMP deaminase
MELDRIRESDQNWIQFFFDICDTVSKKSKDPSTKVGCVIVNSGNSIISTGYNGFPIGVNDNIVDTSNDTIKMSKRYERPEKYSWTAHAEENAIALAARNGVSLKGATLYVNRMQPCTRCTRLLIQAGIKKVYVMQDVPDETIQRWKEDNDIADIMMEEAGIDILIFKKTEKIK